MFNMQGKLLFFILQNHFFQVIKAVNVVCRRKYFDFSPDEVVVTETETENEIVLKLSVAPASLNKRATVLKLSVAPADMGKVIGKQGKIAKAIRTVVRASASKSDKKIQVDIQ